MSEAKLRMAVIAYNATLLNQPKESRDQPAAMRAALAPFLERIKALETENAELKGWRRKAEMMLAVMKANAINYTNKSKARPLTGFVSTLTAEQKEAAMSYEGDDHHGPETTAKEADQ